jgi:tetratricopeptide (TPR) repeat protein
MLCYRRNLTLPLLPKRWNGRRRTCPVLAPFIALLCIVASLCLVACGKSAGQYIERGNKLAADGKYADATINYRNAIKKTPTSGEAYYRLALALSKQGQLGEAYQSFNHAVSLDPKNIPAKIQLANLSLIIYVRDPKHPAVLYKTARSIDDELLAPGGDRVQGLRIKGALALIDNKAGDAVEALREAQRMAPQNQDVAGELAQSLLRNNQPEEAEKIARQAVQQHPQYNQAYEVLYTIYVSQQSWDKAETLMKLWVANDPKESTPVLRLAAFYYARKQADDAEKTLNSLLDHRDRFPQADLLVGDFHSLIRNPEKALADYQRGESRDAERKQAYQERIAGTLTRMGKLPEAIKVTDEILAKDPKSQFARALKVQLLDRTGGAPNLSAAAALAADLVKDTPNNARLQLLAGQALMQAGKLDEAVPHLQAAAQTNPPSEPALLALARLELARKNYAAVLQRADAALAIRPADSNARLFRVIGLTGTHAYGAAKAEAEQLARDTKDAPQVEMQLGVIALGQGHYSEAEQLFRKLYKEGSPDLQPLAGLVNAYEAEHLPDRALALMQQETQRSPDSKGKEALLIATAEADGKRDMALSELQKMAAQNPTSGEVQIRIGALQEASGKLPEALQAFEHARQLTPERKGLDQMIASVQERLGKKPEAIANYRKALKKSPDDPAALNNLAFLMADTGGDTQEALQLVTTAIRKAPNLPQLRDTLAWIQIKRHNEAAALLILETLTREHPDDVTFRYHYAVALADTGNHSAARLQAETALAKKPPAETATELRNLLAQVK